MDFKGKRILVYGAGKSGIGAAELLAKLGAEPVIFDQKEGITPEDLIGKISEEYRQNVRAAVGTVDEQLLAALDAAVLSPGVPTDIPEVIRLRESGLGRSRTCLQGFPRNGAGGDRHQRKDDNDVSSRRNHAGV